MCIRDRIYPIVLSVLLVGVIIFILSYLVPQFQDIFDTMVSLPLPTVILLGLSGGIRKYWPFILLILAAVIFGIRLILRIPKVRWKKDQLKLRLPVIGKLLRKIYTARFARTLCSLYSSGIPIIQAMQIGSSTVGNRYICLLYTSTASSRNAAPEKRMKSPLWQAGDTWEASPDSI